MQKIYEYQEKLMEKEKLFTELEQLAQKNGLLELKNQYRGKKHLFLKIRQRIDAMYAEQKQMETSLKDETELARSMEEALYSGDIKDPKELGFIQDKLEQIQESIEKKQTEQKRIKDALHSEIAYYQYTGEEMKKLQQKFSENQNDLKNKHQAINDRIATINHALETIAKEITPEELNDFLEKRKHHQGRLYAKVIHGNTCGGCYQKMPTPLLNRLKSGKSAVCDHCDRILLYEKEETPAKEQTHKQKRKTSTKKK